MSRDENCLLISILSGIYARVNNSISSIAIGAILTAALCVVYAHVGIPDSAIKYIHGVLTWSYYILIEQSWIYWLAPVLGFAGVSFEEVKRRADVIIRYIRVSSQEQDKKSGKERQKQPLDKEAKKLDCEETIRIQKEWESASTMLRDNIDKILEIVRSHPDKTVVLMLEDIDRLSRAPPFEAAVFLWILTEFEVIFYFNEMGYFDFTNPDQQLIAFFGLYRSRQDYIHIIERTSSGQKKIKTEGGHPGKAPFGFDKPNEDTHELIVNETEAAAIKDAVEELIETDDPVIKSVWREVKNQYTDKIEKFPTYPSFLYILRNKKYTGKTTHNGEVVGELPQIITEEQHENILEKIGKSGKGENDDLDYALQSVIERFGIDSSIKLFDIIKGRCPECGGDVKTIGSTKRWGHRVLKYECIESENNSEKQEDEDNNNCDFSGPLLSRSFLQNWENHLPITCPRCQTPANEEDWKQNPNRIGAVEQTCNECGRWYSVDTSTGSDAKLKRGMNDPEHAISFFDEDGIDDEEEEEKVESSSTDNEESDEDQKGLGTFTTD